MRQLGRGTRAVAALATAAILVGGGLAPSAAAQTPDPSDVVVVLDFSASILEDRANRNRFAAALDRIADRVDETAADLVAGDATVSIVQFATRAAGYQGCSDLKLLGSPSTVKRFATCLRGLAAAYRKGTTSGLTKRVGTDTNYVAAMEEAARHLPADAIRPAVILFTDGRHDVKGVPVSRVQPARDRLFGARPSFALLPVGMGLDPKLRYGLATGLEQLRVIRNMPACVSGATFDWPQVVFQSAAEAGNAVGVALQDATCTFTAEPQPSPTPAPLPAPVSGIQVTPGDGTLELSWAPAPAGAPVPIIDYAARCRAGDGDWIESTEGVSLEPNATVGGLANGTAYTCEVAAISASGPGEYTAASSPATPVGVPAAPSKPTVEALNGAIRVAVSPAPSAGIDTYHFECSNNGGASWPAVGDVSAETAATAIGGVANGSEYVCRAFAANTTGMSQASALSDAVRPCGSALECNPALLPILAGLGAVVAIGILGAIVALFRGRTHGYVVAVVDVVHTANIGHGSRLGITFLRAPDHRRVTGIVADRGRRAEIRIRKLSGGRFAVTDKTSRQVANDGDAIVVVDSIGVRHSLTLRAFATNAASEVASRR
jgi:hypothetical protein